MFLGLSANNWIPEYKFNNNKGFCHDGLSDYKTPASNQSASRKVKTNISPCLLTYLKDYWKLLRQQVGPLRLDIILA